MHTLIIPEVLQEIELTYKPMYNPTAAPTITGSATAVEVCRMIWNEGRLCLQEEFKVLMLNRSNRVMGIYQASAGGITGTVADPRLIFAAALKAGACSLILAHNHPSGGTRPSGADEALTKQMVDIGKLHTIRVLDHIILTADSYFSFADEGLI